jgi:hypothetical protein
MLPLAAYRGVPGLYVLHVDHPVRYPGSYRFGDLYHYVGETVDIERRYQQHYSTWKRGDGSGSAFAHWAGRQGVAFYLAHVIREPGLWRRMDLEEVVTGNPSLHCSRCR